MKRLVLKFLDSYSSQSDHYHTVKTLTICLFLLTPLLILCLVVGVYTPFIRTLFYAMIGLNILVLYMLRTGRFKPAIPVLLAGFSLLSFAVVFGLPYYSPHEVYMLTTAHMFILFTVSLISYKGYYVYLSTGLTSLFLGIHYLLRELPYHRSGAAVSAGIDDYMICLGLMLISGIIITHTLRTKNNLIKQLQSSSEENAKKAEQLGEIYEDLLRVMGERKEMEQQVQQSQKMEAIGTLAGGIAHDFNNILSGIFAYLQLAQNHVHDPVKVLKDIGRIRMGAQKAADLSRQILMISRKSEPLKEVLVLSGIVKEVLGLMRATLPATIEIRETLETGAEILADPGKIHQVVMNLCTNAAQAMADDKGLIEVVLTQKTLAPGQGGEGIPPGEYLCLMVRDTGQGMAPEIRDKIFDPYFTTKAPGKGTGLGLAVVLGIIEEHQGYIRLFSEKGKGSEFQIFFPKPGAGRAAGPEKRSAPHPLPLIFHGRGHILFADDEENLRRATRSLLEEQGYTVTCTGDGQSAWQLFESHPHRYDLVLTDYTMPAMSGTEFIRRIKALSPGTPTILCTGNIERIHPDERNEADALIPKPVDTALLLGSIQSLVLDRPASPKAVKDDQARPV